MGKVYRQDRKSVQRIKAKDIVPGDIVEIAGELNFSFFNFTLFCLFYFILFLIVYLNAVLFSKLILKHFKNYASMYQLY